MDITKLTLVWESEDRPNESGLKQVMDEIVDLVDEKESVEGIIFHTIFVGQDFDGPIVMVYGKEREPTTLYLNYMKQAGWEVLHNAGKN